MSFCRKNLWSLAYWCLLCVQEWLCPSVETVVVTLQNSSVFHSTGFANWTKARNFVPFFSTNAGMWISEFDFATLDVGTHESCYPSSLFWQSLVDLKRFPSTPKFKRDLATLEAETAKWRRFFIKILWLLDEAASCPLIFHNFLMVDFFSIPNWLKE